MAVLPQFLLEIWHRIKIYGIIDLPKAFTSEQRGGDCTLSASFCVQSVSSFHLEKMYS